MLVVVAVSCGAAEQQANVDRGGGRFQGGRTGLASGSGRDCTENDVTRIMRECSDGTARNVFSLGRRTESPAEQAHRSARWPPKVVNQDTKTNAEGCAATATRILLDRVK